MRLRLLILLATTLFAGCDRNENRPSSDFRPPGYRPHPAGHDALIKAIQVSSQVDLLEGVPNVFSGGIPPDCRPEEVLVIRKYVFFRDLQPLRMRDRRAIERHLSRQDAFGEWSGEKLCYGFHPDFCLIMPSGVASDSLMLCFGCGEAKFLSGGAAMHWDILPWVSNTLRNTLRRYQIHSPCRRREFTR